MPVDGIASAASALRYWERRQEIASNNLANATTNGFKAERAFAQLLGTNTPVIQAETDWTEGALTSTGNPLDVSLRGPHFFIVNTPAGERYSRGGAWTIDREGYLADSDGNRVLGEKGAVLLKGSHATIDDTGRVAVDGLWVDRLRVEQLPQNGELIHEAGTRWIPPAERTAVPPDQRDVRQGFLESSNVSSVGSLVDLITIQRNFAFAQKALSTLDDVRATISNQLGKVST